MTDNQRLHRRIEKSLIIQYCIPDDPSKNWDIAIIQNISAGGIKFIAPSNLKLSDKIIKLQIKVPEFTPRLLELMAKVLEFKPRFIDVYSDVRAKFVDLTESNKEDLAVLEKVINLQLIRESKKEIEEMFRKGLNADNRINKRIEKPLTIQYCLADESPKKWDIAIIKNISTGGVRFTVTNGAKLQNKVIELQIKFLGVSTRLLKLEAIILKATPLSGSIFFDIRAQFINLTEKSNKDLSVLEKALSREEVKNVKKGALKKK